jgi:hypothetical protein
LSFDFRERFAQNNDKRGRYLDRILEPNMPAYEICYLDEGGALTYKFTADCDDDQRAKILAHAMKMPSARKLEVWSGEALIYARPSVIFEQQMLHAS